MTESQIEELIFDWSLWARENQIPPAWDWYVWLLLSGRGGGKTRTGAELINTWAKNYSPIALVGKTKADVRDTMVEEGESSLLKISPPWCMPEYESSKRRVTWPNGATATIFSGDEPDQLRGPQHMKAWVDELAKFKYAQESWDNLMFGLRVGDNPQAVVTTTPRPIKVIKDLVADAKTAVTKGHTLENRANLAPSFLRYIMRKYGGTRLGKQELAGDILDDNPDALWIRDNIDSTRVSDCPDLISAVIGVDPAVSAGEDSSDTGIIGAGTAKIKGEIHGFVLGDWTIKGSPAEWANAAVAGFRLIRADAIVGEVNNGGDMVEYTVRTVNPRLPFRQVRASRGKYIRAQPVAALYEQGRIHHVGFYPDLEDQMCEWVPGDDSPDRLDALVWAITELMLLEEEPQEKVIVYDAMKHVRGIDIG